MADRISAAIGGVLLTALGLAAFGFEAPTFAVAFGASLAGGVATAALAHVAGPLVMRKRR